MLVRMKSLEEGVTTPRTVRVPDALWARLTGWAERSGLGNSEALRTLLALGLESEAHPYCNPPIPWMEAVDLTQWVFACVPPGRDWWDLDSVVGQIPGAQRYVRAKGAQSGTWWQIPKSEEESLRVIFAGRPERLWIYGS